MPPVFGVTTMGESVVGGRHSQEDRFIIESNFNSLIKMRGDGKRRLFTAVFDGHGGEECSEFLSKRFPEELADHPEIQTDPQAALTDVWDKMDDMFLSFQMRRTPSEKMTKARKDKKERFHRDGSTATVCLIVDNDAYIAYVGDSCPVAFKTNDENLQFGDVHNTSNPDEVKRVLEAGGKVRRQGEVGADQGSLLTFCFQMGRSAAPLRISPGGLLVTRAFGDFQAKMDKYGGLPNLILSSFDQVHHVKIDDNVEQIILASDGIWDAMSAGDVRVCVNRTALAEQGRPAGNIFSSLVHQLLQEAIIHPYWARKSSTPDNATAVLIHFHTKATTRRFADILRC